MPFPFAKATVKKHHVLLTKSRLTQLSRSAYFPSFKYRSLRISTQQQAHVEPFLQTFIFNNLNPTLFPTTSSIKTCEFSIQHSCRLINVKKWPVEKANRLEARQGQKRWQEKLKSLTAQRLVYRYDFPSPTETL